MGSNIKLVYMYVCENDLFEKVEINFTNEYRISINEALTEISIEENSDFVDYAGKLYSPYVNNISAFVGENGSGKTTLLNCLGMQDRESLVYYSNLNFFLLYKTDYRDYWYLELKENNKDTNKENNKKSSHIFNFISNRILDREGAGGERHWLSVKYDSSKKQFRYGVDRRMDTLFPGVREEHESFKYLFYRDQSAELTGWTHNCGLKVDEKDYMSSVVERTWITNSVADIYSFYSEKNQLVKEVIKRKRGIECEVILHSLDSTTIDWGEYDERDARKTFIIQMLINICEKRIVRVDAINYKAFLLQQIRKSTRLFLSIKDYEKTRDNLLHMIIQDDNILLPKLSDIVKKLEAIEEVTFRMREGVRGCRSCEVMSFGVSEQFNEQLHDVLVGLNNYNQERELFTYSYDFLSAGEAKCLDVFAGIYQTIKNKAEHISNKSLVIVLDEVDKGMHPELARNLIRILNDFSDELGEELRCSFQFILSTHSPFLILDIPDINVHRIRTREGGGKSYIQTGSAGVMSNIVDLIKDSFFLKSIFGELCERFFSEIQEDIMKLQENSPRWEIDGIRNRIEQINEESLKQFLFSRLEGKLENIIPNKELIDYYKKRVADLEKEYDKTSYT